MSDLELAKAKLIDTIGKYNLTASNIAKFQFSQLEENVFAAMMVEFAKELTNGVSDMEKPQFIITSEAKELFDCNKKSLGMGAKRALFYLPSIGRGRIYRDSLNEHNNSFKLLIYKRKSRADEVCKEINEAYNDSFKVETLTDEYKNSKLWNGKK